MDGLSERDDQYASLGLYESSDLTSFAYQITTGMVICAKFKHIYLIIVFRSICLVSVLFTEILLAEIF